jgi:hypothetical protein
MRADPGALIDASGYVGAIAIMGVRSAGLGPRLATDRTSISLVPAEFSIE